jgi:flagellin
MASFSVVSNISAANAQANLVNTNMGLQKAITRLSSGFRINQAGDDAAGLQLANTYRSTQAVLNQGIRNANDALSTLQIKDGALNNIGTLLDRLSTLATQSASASNSLDRTALQAEFTDVRTEITREVAVAGLGSSQGFSAFISSEAVAANGSVGDTIAAADTTTLGINLSAIDTAANALTAVAAIATAVTKLGTAQSSVGSLENRLSFAISLANSQVVSNKAAESRIRDANVAEESANLTRYSVLTQSGIAALAQANNQSQSVLKLLG